MLLLPFPFSRRTPALKKFAKRTLKRIPVLAPILSKTWHYIHDPVRRIRRVFDPDKPISIVQIGSNDGKTLDPLHQLLVKNKNWRALFVEPVPFLFQKLRANYGDDPRFHFENVAIAELEKEMPFYYISESAKAHIPNLPFWYEQLGSFKEGHIRKHLDEHVVPFIETVDIPTISLSTLLQRNKVEAIDFLHIDAEGYDWVILSQLDMARYQPAAILLEHVHLDANAKREARRFLKDYRIYNLGADYFCVRRSRAKKSVALAGKRRISPRRFGLPALEHARREMEAGGTK